MGAGVPLHPQPNQDRGEGSEFKATPLQKGKAWGKPDGEEGTMFHPTRSPLP